VCEARKIRKEGEPGKMSGAREGTRDDGKNSSKKK